MGDPLEVDGSRPAVAAVAALPRSYRLTDAEWRVLMVLACDSFDGKTSAPGMDNLAEWSGLLRSSAARAVARLLEPTEHRPALLAKPDASRGRRRTEYSLSFNRPATPDGSTVRPTVSEQSPDRPVWPDGQQSPNRPVTPDAPFSLGALLPSPDDDVAMNRHGHHDNAMRGLEELVSDRRLPISAAELIAHAYRLGNGDPWEGYKEIKHRTERNFAGSNDPKAVLMARLRSAA
ncbi:hypothetical protein ACH436_12440 [Isoptericola sp. NPDC019693]|uniref:hypothetical protein n=1 Tax=Isoptericola sp. NPDC019693 TaxID=3364009 RepID=UPI00378BBA47